MTGREGWAVVDPDGEIIAVHLGERSGSRFSDAFLERRGLHIEPVRILVPDALDNETLERAAQVADRQGNIDWEDGDGGQYGYGYESACSDLAIKFRALEKEGSGE